MRQKPYEPPVGENAKDRADKLIKALEEQRPGMVLNGALKAAIIAKANDLDQEHIGSGI